MKKILAVLILSLSLVGSSFADIIRYQVKYQTKWGNIETAVYEVDTETIGVKASENDINEVKAHYKFHEILDEDSDAKDLAIVNKLDKQGYKLAFVDDSYGLDFDLVSYMKLYNIWHKFYGIKWNTVFSSDKDEPVILNE